MQLLCKLNWKLQKKCFRIPDGSLISPKIISLLKWIQYLKILITSPLFLLHKQTNWPSKRFTDTIVIIFPSVCYLFVWILTMKGNIHHFPWNKWIVKTLSQVIIGWIIVFIVIRKAKFIIIVNKLVNARIA